MKRILSGLCLAVLWAGSSMAQSYVGDVAIGEEDVKLGAKHYSPNPEQSCPNRVLWGDTHLHTSIELLVRRR